MKRKQAHEWGEHPKCSQKSCKPYLVLSKSNAGPPRVPGCTAIETLRQVLNAQSDDENSLTDGNESAN